MNEFIKKIWKHRFEIRSILQSIYFNFHYLPFKHAIKIPILLYKPHFRKLKESIDLSPIIVKGGVKYGMIRLGFPMVSIYPNTGIMIENHGGRIIFNGKCSIGNNSYISVGQKGTVMFGDEFSATTSLRLVVYDSVLFGDRISLGWDILVMDTDFHKLTKLSGGYSRGHAPVEIGADNWFGNGCKIMKGTKTPNYCVCSAGTVLSGIVSAPEYSVIGTKQDIIVKTTGVWRNIHDDKVQY